MKLKERFSRWYNKQNGRRGTLWMDRFKSVIVENGEASGGSRRARRGLCKVLGVPQDSWEAQGAKNYRCWLYGEGVSVAEDDPMIGGKRRVHKKGFTVKQMLKVKEKQGGEVSAKDQFRKRISTFTNGVVIGSENYVKKIAEHYREEFGRLRVKSGKRFQLGNAVTRREVYVMRE